MSTATIPQISETASIPVPDDYLELGGATEGSRKILAQSIVAKVATIAALKALAVSDVADGQSVYVQGYYAKNDGGQGFFYYLSYVSSTDNGGTIIAPDSGSGRWLRQVSGKEVTVDQFGAVGDGATDDRNFIQAAIDWAESETRATVRLGAKTYLISDYLTINANYVAFKGQGQNYSRLLISHTSNDVIRVGQSGGSIISVPSLSGFGISRSVNATGGTGISLIRTALAKISDIHVDGCQVGFYFSRATNSSVRRCIASCGTTATNFIGFHWDGGASGTDLNGPYSSTMTDCIVDATSCSGTSRGLKLDGNSIADLYVYNLSTLRCSYGRYIDGTRATSAPVIAANGQPYNWDIKMVNCVDDGYTVHGLFITANSLIGAITDIATWTNPGATAGTGSGIYVEDSRGVSIESPQIMNIDLLATARGITVDGCFDVSIKGGRVINMNFGVYLLGSSLCSVDGVTVFNESTLVGSTAVLFNTTTRSKVVNTIVDGYQTTGISSATGDSCAKNIIGFNTVNPDNIGTEIVATGAGDVSANNVTT